MNLFGSFWSERDTESKAKRTSTAGGGFGVGRRKAAVLGVWHRRNGEHEVIVGVHVLRGHHVLILPVYIVLYEELRTGSTYLAEKDDHNPMGELLRENKKPITGFVYWIIGEWIERDADVT